MPNEVGQFIETVLNVPVDTCSTAACTDFLADKATDSTLSNYRPSVTIPIGSGGDPFTPEGTEYMCKSVQHLVLDDILVAPVFLNTHTHTHTHTHLSLIHI